MPRAGLDLPDTLPAPRIGPAGGREERQPGIVELAVRESRAGMAHDAVAAPQKQLQAVLRRLGIIRSPPLPQRVAKVIERRARRDDRLLEGGQCPGTQPQQSPVRQLPALPPPSPR